MCSSYTSTFGLLMSLGRGKDSIPIMKDNPSFVPKQTKKIFKSSFITKGTNPDRLYIRKDHKELKIVWGCISLVFLGHK